MWSLGAVMSFYCNERHLFTNFPSILKWKGGKSPINNYDLEYSSDLRQIVANLLSPKASRRPTAQKVDDESMKNNRQRLDLPH